MQGPGISDLEVATLSDLTDLHVAPLTDRSTCFVISENSLFRLYKDGGGFSANGVDVIAPEAGSPRAGAEGARWVLVGDVVVQSAATTISGAIGTEDILDGASTHRVLIPENSTENYSIQLMVRRNADGAALYYEREVTVTRDGAGAPLLQETTLVTHENVGGADPWPAANASFPTTTAVLVAGQYYLVVSFAQANAATTASTAKATVTRNSPIAS